MKPNRNYFKSQTKELYKYVAFDYLNQVMSVSMREDKEFNDNVTLKSKIDLNHKQENRVDLTWIAMMKLLKIHKSLKILMEHFPNRCKPSGMV
jgi:hypothetical protein